MGKKCVNFSNNAGMEDEVDARVLYGLANVFYNMGLTIHPDRLLISKSVFLNSLNMVSEDEALRFRREVLLSDLETTGTA